MIEGQRLLAPQCLEQPVESFEGRSAAFPLGGGNAVEAQRQLDTRVVEDGRQIGIEQGSVRGQAEPDPAPRRRQRLAGVLDPAAEEPGSSRGSPP